jgi:hypothetical protein
MRSNFILSIETTYDRERRLTEEGPCPIKMTPEDAPFGSCPQLLNYVLDLRLTLEWGKTVVHHVLQYFNRTKLFFRLRPSN